MEFSKKKLLDIIQESFDTSQEVEIDEMAKPASAEFRHLVWYNGEVHDGCSEPYCDRRKQKLIDGAILIGWVIDGNPTLFVCKEQELRDFETENPEIYSKLIEKYPNAFWVNRQLGSCVPRPRKPEVINPTGITDPTQSFEKTLQYKTPETSMETGEKIKRYSGGKLGEGFNTIIENSFENNEDLQKHLRLCSIPPILADRTHVDRYAKVSNDEVNFTTHSFDFYGTQEQFLKSVVDKVRGRIPENESGEYMPRLFNKQYRNWDPERKSEEKNFGKTDIYGLKKFGFDENQINVMVSSVFSIKGRRHNTNGFIWNISLETKFGKKLQEDPKVDNLTKDKHIVISKPVEADNDRREFNNDYTIMDKLSIKQGLLEAIHDFTQKVMEISPEDALELADITSSEKLAESFDEIIKDVIRENKK